METTKAGAEALWIATEVEQLLAAQRTLHEKVGADTLRAGIRALVGELGRMSVQRLKQQRRESYLAAVEAYSAAAEELRAKGVAIHRRTLQETSGLVAFSRNSARARALSEVLARERTNLQPPSADGPAEAAR